MGAGTRKKIERVCALCGALYTCNPHHIGISRYCSRACRDRAVTKRVTLHCSVCNSLYEVIPAQITTSRYCSPQCRHAAQEHQVEVHCAYCDKAFFVTEFQAQRREYCSNTCRGKAARKQVERTCTTCGKTFQVKLSRAERSSFCSHACRRFYGGETSIERDVRLALTRLQIDYVQEHYIQPYRIDFYLPQWQIALEVDGLYWHDPRRDSKRDRYLAAIGVTTIRITDAELDEAPYLEVVASKLQRYLA